MKIIEFVFTNNAIFITNNYCIKNGYIERRRILCCVEHNKMNFLRNLNNTTGLGYYYKNILKSVGKEHAVYIFKKLAE